MDNNKNIDIEKVENIILYKNDFDIIIEDYCNSHNIDINDIPPLIWCDILLEIYENIFAINREYLRNKSTSHNEYNKDKVLYYYNIYKRLCMSHNQEVSQKGFLDMTGIEKQTLYNWNSDGLGSSRFDLQEKIQEDNQQSLEKLMFDRRNNPMKYLPKLNRYHGYNMSGVRSETPKNTALSVQELPSLTAINCTENTNNSDTENE